MIYLIAAGMGVGCAIAYSIYRNYNFKKFEETCERLVKNSNELSQPQNISKLVKIINERKKSQNP